MYGNQMTQMDLYAVVLNIEQNCIKTDETQLSHHGSKNIYEVAFNFSYPYDLTKYFYSF